MAKDKTGRLTVPIGAELDAALKSESEDTGAPVTEIMRRAAVQYLRGRGHNVEDTILRGGYRGRKRKSDEPGQRVAVTVN